MQDDAVEITHAFVEAGRSINGGWTKEQLAILGIDFPPVKGWKKKVCGRKQVIPRDQAERFLSLKDSGRRAKARLKREARREAKDAQPTLFSE
jgi:hypothetical protein